MINDKTLVVANWKATKTIKETIDWIKATKTSLEKVDYADVVICVPFTSLPIAASLFQDTNIKVGAQNISKFKKGAFTGEVTVEMLDGLASHCIVGHSERRKYFGETDDDVIEKVELLLDSAVIPVLCVSDIVQLDSYLQKGRRIIDQPEKIIFVYEPPQAISGGEVYHPENPETANENSGRIKEKIGKPVTTIYGGSVNPENVASFVSQPYIQGVLPGQASTDSAIFLDLLNSLKIDG